MHHGRTVFRSSFLGDGICINLFRQSRYTRRYNCSLVLLALTGDDWSHGTYIYHLDRRRRPRHPLPAGRLPGVERLPRPQRGRRHRHVEAARRIAPRPGRARPQPAWRRRPDAVPQAARPLDAAGHHADRPQRTAGPHPRPRNGRRRLPAETVRAARVAGAHPQRAAPQPCDAVQFQHRPGAADALLRLDAGPHRASPAQSGRHRHHAVGRRIPPAQGLPRTSEPRAQPRPAAEPDARPRRRSVRPFDRHPDQPPAAKARRGRTPAANHQDRAQRRLRAGRPGHRGRADVKAFLASMTGRVFLVLLLGIVVSAALTQWLAVGERTRALERYRDFHALERAEQLITTADVLPEASRPTYLRMAHRGTVRLEATDLPLATALPPTEFSTTLQQRLGAGYKLAPLDEHPAACDLPRKSNNIFAPNQWRGTCETMNVQLHDGQVLKLSVLPPRAPPPSGHSELMAMLPFLFSIAALAYLVTRMTVRPLKQLAQAAKDLGNDINHPPVVLSGAAEIRQASAAFNAMQARIRQHIMQRTQMLAAITHDLQTPLTRLRLRLEKVSDQELQQRLVRSEE